MTDTKLEAALLRELPALVEIPFDAELKGEVHGAAKRVRLE